MISENDINTVLTGLAIALILAGIYGTLMLLSAYRLDTDKYRSWLLKMLVVASAAIEIIGTYFLVVNTIRRFYGVDALPSLFLFVHLVAIMFLIAIPAYFALVIRRNT